LDFVPGANKRVGESFRDFDWSLNEMEGDTFGTAGTDAREFAEGSNKGLDGLGERGHGLHQTGNI
jgi:hypothetical protein